MVLLDGCAFKDCRRAFYFGKLAEGQKRRKNSVLQLEWAIPAGWSFRIWVFHSTPTGELLSNKRNVTLHDNEITATFSSDRDTQELFHEQSTSSKTRAGIPYPMGFYLTSWYFSS